MRVATDLGAKAPESDDITEWFVLISDPEPSLEKTLVMIGGSLITLGDALTIHDAADLIPDFRRHGKKPLSEAIRFWGNVALRTRRILHVSLEEFDRMRAGFRSYASTAPMAHE